MQQGLDVLRLLFYVNLIGSERDTLETIETEKQNEQVMEIELAHRRQRRNDGDGDDDDEEDPMGGRQQTPNSTTTTSPHRQTSRISSMRNSTNEHDDIEFSYENPLQIKLELEPNEYRHGHLPFDDFINEFANEKIDISKEYLNAIRQTVPSTRFSFISYPFFLSTINKIGRSTLESFLLKKKRKPSLYF